MRKIGSRSVSHNVQEGAPAISANLFVRSQLQLAKYVEGAKGRVLTRREAEDTFGAEAVERVLVEGCFPLIAESDEPAWTIRARRSELNVTAERLAQKANVKTIDVEEAETSGTVIQIHKLERIAQALALDERVIGHEKGARGDRPLGVRLRETLQQVDVTRFGEGDVLRLAEAAWVIARQVALDEAVNSRRVELLRFEPSPDYRYRAYDRGEELAVKTRDILRIDTLAPIPSLKALSEETLRIPVIQERLGEQFAGATVANGMARGIVLNECGMNENVWVRRMTLAHELGHLLWDPESSLNRLKVHSYDDVQGGGGRLRDPVEMRANAFAVNFLAPRQAVQRAMAEARVPVEGVRYVMTTYGISATAAKLHVRNMTGIDVDVRAHQMGRASDDWVGRENMAIDVFRPESTPLSRRGKFAWHVVIAEEHGVISEDTGAAYLRSTVSDFRQNRAFIKELLRAP